MTKPTALLLATLAFPTLALAADDSTLALKVEVRNLSRRLLDAQAEATQCDAGWSTARVELNKLILRLQAQELEKTDKALINQHKDVLELDAKTGQIIKKSEKK